MMKIVFMGTPDFARHILGGLIGSRHSVCAVFTQADRKKNRGMKLTPPPVKVEALAHDIPVYQPGTLKSEEVRAIFKELAPDIVVVAAYGKLLPQSILTLPPHGCINVHASLLPKYRGASPINAAILNGEPQSGVCIMQMDKGLDTGDLLHCVSLALSPDETYGSLHDRLMQLGRDALLEALDLIEEGRISPQKQDGAHASHAPLIKPEHAKICFQTMHDEAVCRHIKAYDPVPGAFGVIDGQKIKLFMPHKAALEQAARPGSVVKIDKHGVYIACLKGAVRIERVQGAGKKQMAAADFFRGRPQLLEDVFE